jgi:hypothetical protein
MKAKRQIESSLNSITMLDGTGGHVNRTRRTAAGFCVLRYSINPS